MPSSFPQFSRLPPDILYLPDRATFQHFTGDVCSSINPSPSTAWVTEVRHIAVALDMSDNGIWLPIALARLQSLETLSVEFPAAVGTFDHYDEVPVPDTAGTPVKLRLVASEETASVKVTADYVYWTPVGGRDSDCVE
jgi:hypothetical protein